MESLKFTSWFSLLVSLFVPMFFLIFLLNPKKKNSNHENPNFPPSPPKLPIIGNFHQLGELPHRSLWKLAGKHGPLMLLHLGRAPTLVVSSAAWAAEILKFHDPDFCSRPYSLGWRRLTYGYLDVAFTPYGDHWRNARKLFVSELLNPKREKLFWVARKTEIDHLIESLKRESAISAVNLDEKIIDFVVRVLGEVAFGKECRGKQFGGKKLKELMDDSMEVLDGFSFEDFFPWIGKVLDGVRGRRRKIEQCFRKLDGFYEAVIEEHLDDERRKKEDEDFVDVLVGLSKGETGDFRLSRNHIKAILLNTFLGGTDTTAMTIVWAMSELMNHPRVMHKLQLHLRDTVKNKSNVEPDDLPNLKYLKMVVKETLRLHPPSALLIPHLCMRACRIGYQNYDVLPNTRVLVNAWAIGRDPNSWNHPEEFYPERFENSEVDFRGRNFELLPFGGGRRVCPGINMSVTTVEFTLANLLYCFDWEVVGGGSVNMEEKSGIVVHKRTPLCVVPIKYEGQE